MFRGQEDIRKRRILQKINGIYNVTRNSHSFISNLNGGRGPFSFDENSSFVDKGLPNQGNTCYLASILQCLNGLSSFARHLVDHRFSFECIYSFRSFFGQYRLFDEFVKLMYNGFNSIQTNPYLTFDRCVGNFFAAYNEDVVGKRFRMGIQHDASEFFLEFLSYLDMCFAEIKLGQRGLANDEDLNRLYAEFESLYGIGNCFFKIRCKNEKTCLLNQTHVSSTIDVQKIICLPVAKLYPNSSSSNRLSIQNLTSIEECFEEELNTIISCNCIQCNIYESRFDVSKRYIELSQYLIISFSRFQVNT
jgi:ubiquitin C-terminal hydrolase